MKNRVLQPSLSAGERSIVGVAACLALLYWLSLWGPDYPGHWLLKASPMLLAAVLLARTLSTRFAFPMAIGYLAAAGGDIFLALDRDQFLMQALLCFLVTQIAYVAAFSGQTRPLAGRWKFWLPAVIYGALMYLIMLPGLGGFLLPVLVYVTVLVAMVIAASLVERKPGLLLAGAALFLIADSLIGLNRFVTSLTVAEPIIVAIYTSGQLMILVGALRALPRQPAARLRAT